MIRKVIATLLFVAFAAGPAGALERQQIASDPGPASGRPVTADRGSRLELVDESFEGYFPPAGWQVLSYGDTWTWSQSTGRVRTGSFSAAVYYGPAGSFQDEWLVSPALNTTGLDALLLEFYEEGQYWHPLYAEHHYVLASTTVADDPAAYDTLLDMTPANHTIAGFDGEPVVIDLSAYLDQETVYVALRYVGTSSDHWWVDDLRVYSPESHDIKTTAVGPENAYFHDGDLLTPTAEFRNLGAQPESFDVSVSVHRSGVEVHSDTRTVAALPPGETISVTFAGTLVSAGSYYEIVATAHLSGDTDPTNDSRGAFSFAYSQPRVPFGLLVTNWYCSGCPQANAWLNDYLANQGNDVAVVRVHCWWPSETDPMFLANEEQCRALIEETPWGSDYAPHLWIDNFIDAGADGTYFAGFFEGRKQDGAPLTLSIVYDAAGERCRVVVDVLEELIPDHDYTLRLAITEDDFDPGPPGGNEDLYQQVFHCMYPDLEGAPVATAGGSQEFWIDTPLDPAWVLENLRATAYVYDHTARQVVNAGTVVLVDVAVAVNQQELPARSTLWGIHPNPCNPRAVIRFSLVREQDARVDVFDLAGRRVATLHEGRLDGGVHAVVWNGADDAGRALPAGAYLVRLRAEATDETQKLMLVR